MHILPIFYLHHKHYDAFCARASHCGWEETGDAVSEIIIIICELWTLEEYQGWRLMEILFAVIFLNRKRAQYYNNVFWANFSEMFIISFDYPFRSFSFLKTGAAFKRIVSKHSITSEPSLQLTLDLYDRETNWYLDLSPKSLFNCLMENPFRTTHPFYDRCFQRDSSLMWPTTVLCHIIIRFLIKSQHKTWSVCWRISVLWPNSYVEWQK